MGSSGPSEYMEVPLGSLELPSEGTLSPNHAGNCQLPGQGATRGCPQGWRDRGGGGLLPVPGYPWQTLGFWSKGEVGRE